MTAGTSPNWILTTIAGLTAVVAGVPLAALAFAVPQHGDMRVPQRWWRGNPAPSWAVLVLPLLTAPAAVLACAHRAHAAAVPAFWIAAVLGTAQAAIDLRCRRLPHPLTGVLWATTATGLTVDMAITGDVDRLATAVLTAAATGGALLLIALALPGQFGLGDVNFASALALSLGWLHWSAAPTSLLVAFSLQAGIALGLRALGRRIRGPHGGIPMGPAFILGWLLVAFFTKG